MSISGGLFHAHAAWRPLAALSDYEMNQLDVLTKKLLGPGEDDVVDTPQNQTESKRAIEVEALPLEGLGPFAPHVFDEPSGFARFGEDTCPHACDIFGEVRNQDWVSRICSEADRWHLGAEILSRLHHK